MATTNAFYRRAIQRGIALLNQQAEPGWTDRIYPNSLHIQSSLWCVLGQLYGTYQIGVQRLGLDRSFETNAYHYGFVLVKPDDTERVNKLWREAIAVERAPKTMIPMVPETRLTPIKESHSDS